MLSITLPFRAAFAQDRALLIIDMQPKIFLKYVPNDIIQGHRAVAQKLVQKQLEMIEAAKKQDIPIMFVEYDTPEKNFGPTYQALKNSVRNYKKVESIKKSQDDLFDERNPSAKEALKIFKNWGTKRLVVMGVNGLSCVQDTIKGALKNDFDVTAYTDGIAHSYINEVTYPVTYASEITGFGKDISITRFNQTSQIKDALGLGVPQHLSKDPLQADSPEKNSLSTR